MNTIINSNASSTYFPCASCPNLATGLLHLLKSQASSTTSFIHHQKTQKQSLSENTFLKVNEAANLLQVHRKTIYRWIKKGKIPCMRWNPLRLRTTDVIALMNLSYFDYD